MRVLITGASSPLAVAVLRRLLVQADHEFWCGHHRSEIPISDPRLHLIDLDLKSDLSAALSVICFDMVIHFAGVTHASDEDEYWNVNFDGTIRLAQLTHRNGCRRFVYVSTRCATDGSGAYGESKLAAEQELQKLEWESLLIIRPSEIYGGSSEEGIDRMMTIARKWRISPALFGHSNLLFAPLHIDDFSSLVADLIEKKQPGLRIEHACGPENLSGFRLAWRIAKHYGAIPLPLWWPAVDVSLRILHRLGFSIVKPDQLKRLIGRKTAKAQSDIAAQQRIRPFLASWR